MTILDEIFTYKKIEVARRKQEKSLVEVRAEVQRAVPPLDFAAALRTWQVIHGTPALIAEVKKASPSKGLLAPDFDPVRLARIYQENGAAAISVLTDAKYFQGSLDYLRQIAALAPRLPLLRKDFLCDPYQVYEARAAGADAVLLIAAYLESYVLRELYDLTRELGMTPLVEVHNLLDLRNALACVPVLIGINNRDLRDFIVNLETTLHLMPHIPAGVGVVAESGIQTPEDVNRLAAVGVMAILVGEALVTAEDVAAKVRILSGR
jgi:indole-3-glycerol phosphate synthase